ncbi:MAG: hypothetical protein NVV59_08570 [Chitinophagaceae bacterium]|nr:hypothetical protein [Chitinophagaceae bacterium]
MRIAQLNNFITLNGGSETVMQNLTVLLEQHGHVVRNIGFHSLHNDQLMQNAVALGKEKYSVPGFFFNKKLVKQVVEKIREWKAELIICHNVYHKYPMADLLKTAEERIQCAIGNRVSRL